MKRSILVFVLAILITGLLPSATAQNTGAAKYNNMQIQAINSNENGTPLTIKEKLRDQIQEARQITQGKLKAARERYQEAKQKYIQARERYQEAKQKITKARTALQACRDSESEQCISLRKQIKANSKEFLVNIADRVLATLEKIRSKVESNEDIDEEESASLLTNIDEKIAEIENAKETIEGLTNESSAEDIKEAAQTIREAWRKTRAVLKKSVGRLLNARIGGIIVKSEALGDKLERIKARLEESGNDMSDIKGLINKFNNEVEEAKAKWESAKQRYAEAVTPGEIDEIMKEVHEYIKEAHQKLKEAHQTLKEIMQKIREKKGAQEALEAEEESGEEEEVQQEAEQPENETAE
jgi:DNA repair exonuclease SbcCD ATPase subunit